MENSQYRSWVMGRVRSTGNRSTELLLRSLFRKYRITGWRRHYRIHGKPDFAFPRLKLAIFVDGDFWHRHPTRCRLPKSNAEYWSAKIRKNWERDRSIDRKLEEQGWRIIRVWESDLKASPEAEVRKVLEAFQLLERTDPGKPENARNEARLWRP
jgi:DNA mismatch endonuclease, patch repair protein